MQRRIYVVCAICGKTELPEDEYKKQLWKENQEWRCPNCAVVAVLRSIAVSLENTLEDISDLSDGWSDFAYPIQQLKDGMFDKLNFVYTNSSVSDLYKQSVEATAKLDEMRNLLRDMNTMVLDAVRGYGRDI